MLIQFWQLGCEGQQATRQSRLPRRGRKGLMLFWRSVPNRVGWFPSRLSEKGAGGQKGGVRGGGLDLAWHNVGFGMSRDVGRQQSKVLVPAQNMRRVVGNKRWMVRDGIVRVGACTSPCRVCTRYHCLCCRGHVYWVWDGQLIAQDGMRKRRTW